jgi:hypothetical protein
VRNAAAGARAPRQNAPDGAPRLSMVPTTLARRFPCVRRASTAPTPLVFRESRALPREQNHAARMSEDDRRAHVPRIEHGLHCHRVGFVSRNDFADSLKDVGEPFGERGGRCGTNHAAL